MDRIMAEITSFRQDSGWGFAQDTQGKSYFVHARYVRDKLIPRIGDLVTLIERDSPNKPGKTEAFDIIIVKRASSKPVFVAPTLEGAK